MLHITMMNLQELVWNWRECILHTKIMKAWEYLYTGKYCLDQGNLIMMMCSHTYMKGQLRRILIWLCQWKSQIAVSPFQNFLHPNTNKDDDAIEWMTRELSGDKDQIESFTCAFTADYVDDATFQTPQKSKQGSFGEGTECVETEMRQCQGNSLFLLPATQKLHDSIEKGSKDTQALYTTKSLREARKNIIASVDHILQHD
jgi:hypothetical protein